MVPPVILTGTLAELLFVGSVEGGIVVEAAGGTGMGGGGSVIVLTLIIVNKYSKYT